VGGIALAGRGEEIDVGKTWTEKLQASSKRVVNTK
jgi:hypothetical protein